ncbi:MAG: ABC transporter permease [Gemmatimonadota bacterium]|nr:ABC transporter permease [Gemmatimonadota bacterium]
MSWLHGTRARLRLIVRRTAESRMAKEIRFHIDLETERLVRDEGLDPEEARRRALVAFGGVERHKEELREGRGLAWLGGMLLDFKLGFRMLVKYPGLTVVGVLGMAVAVAIGSISFGLIYTMFDPAVPLHEGERVVAIQNINARRIGEGRRTHLHDLATWRETLRAVEPFGAYRTTDRNLITHEGRPEPVRIAEMTASGFRVARVPPLIGRYFSDEDESAGAPPVVVIGYSVWQGRFAGQPNVVGRTLRLGNTPHTVIGVMPQGFAFPINNRVWTPLKLNPSEFERGKAPGIDVFGRLAPGASLADARTQLSAIAQRLTAAYPETHQHIRARVIPYARAFTDDPESAALFHLIQLLVTMLLVVIGTNVAILVYARTASRTREIAVRSALGASRGRIVAQLFAEALVLSVTASAVGLVVGWLSLARADAYLERMGGEQIPFWMDFGISTGMVLYVMGLAVLGAVIVGILPALKATRRQLHATLQQGSGGTAMRLGKTWTVMIVAQVALAVATLPLAIAGIMLLVRQELAKPAIPPAEWMTAALYMDGEGNAGAEYDRRDRVFEARYANLQSELIRLVRTEPGVVAVVLTSAVPGDEPTERIELEGEAVAKPDTGVGAGSTGHEARVAGVDIDLLGAFDIPLLTGRRFRVEDVSASASSTLAGARAGLPVIVNRSFVKTVLGGGDPLGRRVRRVVRNRDVDSESVNPEPWSEIVGVVPDFPNPVNPRFLEPRMYEPLAAGAVNPVTLAVRVRGGAPAEFGGRLRDLTLAVDPMLRLQSIAALDESLRDRLLELRVTIGVVVLVTLSVLLLSAAGIYALISFTVTRRRREIGIRAALGAGPRQVIRGVLTGAMRQISVGIVIGIALAGVMDHALNGGATGGRGIYLLAAVAVLMGAVGLVAAIGPARRALRIQPTEALKSD